MTETTTPPEETSNSTETNPESETTQNADDPIQKIKTSTSRLATSLGLLTKDIDSKLGISTKAQQIDEQIHATERTKQALGIVAATASNLDQKFHVSETTRNTASAVGSSVAAQGIKSRVGGVLEGAGNSWNKLDQNLNLTSKTANFVSSTADFLSSKIAPDAASSVTVPDESLAAAMKEVDGSDDNDPNFPSSFQK